VKNINTISGSGVGATRTEPARLADKPGPLPTPSEAVAIGKIAHMMREAFAQNLSAEEMWDRLGGAICVAARFGNGSAGEDERAALAEFERGEVICNGHSGVGMSMAGAAESDLVSMAWCDVNVTGPCQIKIATNVTRKKALQAARKFARIYGMKVIVKLANGKEVAREEVARD
jgi:hypothetical protein